MMIGLTIGGEQNGANSADKLLRRIAAFRDRK